MHLIEPIPLRSPAPPCRIISRLLILSLVVASLPVLSTGCNSRPRGANDRLSAETDAKQSTIRQLLPRADFGLEYRRFLIMQDFDRIGSVLAPYARPTDSSKPLPDGQALANLRANGLRIVAIPMDEIDRVIDRLPVEPVRDSTWLGQSTDWMPIAAGPLIEGTRIFRIRGEQASINEGRFRLLIRIYPVTLADHIILRLELLPQLHQKISDPFFSDPVRERLAGDLFTDIACGLNLDGSHAVVLVGESPRVDWEAQQPQEDEDNQSDQAADVTNSNQPDNPQPQIDDMGPKPVPIRTIGEETLQTPAGDMRLLIVFLPRMKTG